MSIEQRFDVPLIAEMALREKQIQQNYRPIIGVHKWFARRPGTLFRGLILAEFGAGRLKDIFFVSHDLSGTRIADPFMGGGTPLTEANRLGCDVHGFDINPMSAWIVREEIKTLDIPAYEEAARSLVGSLRAEIDRYYRTSCPLYGDTDVPVKCFVWVKVLDCEHCGSRFDLFPGYLLAENRRHPANVFVCPDCGDLNAVEDRKSPGNCLACGASLRQRGPARRGRCDCPRCGRSNSYPRPDKRPPAHRLFAIEYFNSRCRASHKGRFFKKPDEEDIARVDAAASRWQEIAPQFVPEAEIVSGDETARLHRWGYARYREMFNPRQLLGLELSCRLIAQVEDKRIRHALATNLSDLLRYQNMLCRYDRMALKSLDIFSVHGFPVGLVQSESNFLGIVNGNGSNVGSGGWTNIIGKYVKAKRYCTAPFEVRRFGSRRIKIPITGEGIGEECHGKHRSVAISCEDARDCQLAPESVDAVFTDPPYFGNVQYAELMDFCYVWLRSLVQEHAEGFDRATTRSPGELTGNSTAGRDLHHFTDGISDVYSRMARALKPGAPLVFTYHHNKLEAYYAIGVSILDAGLACTASLPCPAEMSGSIHIHGTGSSIIDTVFVCRASRTAMARQLFATPEELAKIVAEDVAHLATAGRTATYGDTRCIIFGHLARMAVWNLRKNWNRDMDTSKKIGMFAEAVPDWGDPDTVWEQVKAICERAPTAEPPRTFAVPGEIEQRALSF